MKQRHQVWKRKSDGANVVIQYEYNRGCVIGHTFDIGAALAKHDNMFEGIKARAVRVSVPVDNQR